MAHSSSSSDSENPFSFWRFSVAPMMDWTDRHCRYFHRLLTRHALLYTEMVTADALIYGDRDRLLHFHEAEKKIALQLGGNDPEKLAQAALWAQERGYDEINLNCGCPSDRVKAGAFGASMMLTPNLTAHCISAMKETVSIPVSVKCRIAIDAHDEHVFLDRFAQAVFKAGTDALIVHARKAWLQGLSPKQNRDIPPLNYERVYQLKKDYPDKPILLNGGLLTLEQSLKDIRNLDGVMLGRAAYQNPSLLLDVDRLFFNSSQNTPTKREVVLAMAPYIEAHLISGGRLHQITRHMTGLFQNVSGAKQWRRILSEEGVQEKAGFEVVEKALRAVDPC